jgi:hypothetical protein
METHMALPPRDHRMTLDEAAAHTKRYRDAKIHEVKGGAFHKDQVLELLNQPGCVGLRIYHGHDTAGSPTFVLAGIDKTDSDITKGVLLERQYPCPPFCGGANPLNA